MLTERQVRFVAEYVAGGDPAEAAERAGYSPQRARRQATELLTRPEVQRALEAARRGRFETPGAERVMEELARIAFADPAALLTAPDGDAGEQGRGMGLKLKYTPRRAPAEGESPFELSMEREVRIGDKLRALELLAKYLGLGERGDEDGQGTGVVLLPAVEDDGGGG